MAKFSAVAVLFYWRSEPSHDGVLVISAGTSDEAAAEEAVATLRARGIAYQRLSDCGVAGLHRLLAHRETIEQAKVIIAVAGFEAALTSVVAGLVACPVIGLPPRWAMAPAKLAHRPQFHARLLPPPG